MKTIFFSCKQFERPFIDAAFTSAEEIRTEEKSLCLATASKAKGFSAVSIFAGDDASAAVLNILAREGVRFIAIRAAGYDNVDLVRAKQLDIRVANVPAYSPYAIAEHAVALILALNRKLILSNQHVHLHNFKVDDLIGMDLNGKTVGIIGTGRIGKVFTKIMNGFGCKLLGYDINEDIQLEREYDLKYVDLDTLCRDSDIISLHTSLTPETKYLINKNLISKMKKSVMLINTCRGACVNSSDLIAALENQIIGSYGADVYESERGLFFYDWSNKELTDTNLIRLLSFPNVLITPHQAFATREALTNIAETTFDNIERWSKGLNALHEL